MAAVAATAKHHGISSATIGAQTHLLYRIDLRTVDNLKAKVFCHADLFLHELGDDHASALLLGDGQRIEHAHGAAANDHHGLALFDIELLDAVDHRGERLQKACLGGMNLVLKLIDRLLRSHQVLGTTVIAAIVAVGRPEYRKVSHREPRRCGPRAPR